MPVHKTLATMCVGLFLSGIAIPGTAEAVAIGVCDNSADTIAGSNGTCAKSVTISGNTLTIVLSNTTAPALGGFLTADAFFLANGVTAALSSTTNMNFALSTNPSVSPFDTSGGMTFNYLLSATQNSFEGGGGPDAGIAPGGSATFVLNLSGNVSSLTEAGVLATEALRFRGFVNGGSDKDLVTGGGGGAGGGAGAGQAVPEPMSLLLFGSALLGAAYRSRRARR
jgi:hypothetical protein